jgi:hypothetical protein
MNHAMQDHSRTKKTQGICKITTGQTRRKAFAFHVKTNTRQDRRMTGQKNALTEDARHLHFTSGQKRRKAFAFRVRTKNHAMQDHDRTNKTQGICISRQDKKDARHLHFASGTETFVLDFMSTHSRNITSETKTLVLDFMSTHSRNITEGLRKCDILIK